MFVDTGWISQLYAAGAKGAYDVLYSMTRCEQERYASLGMTGRVGLTQQLLSARGARASLTPGAAAPAAAAPPDFKQLLRTWVQEQTDYPREVAEALKARQVK